MRPDLSIILGTYNRQAMLEECITSIRSSVCDTGISYEIVVCDGGSKDGSREWLVSQVDVVLIAKWGLDGAVDAFNLCARAARGHYIAFLNDDVVVVGDALETGWSHMVRAEAGLGAFETNVRGEWGYADADSWGTLLANVGIADARLVRQVEFITGGFWAPVYRTYGGDNEFSMWASRLGWPIIRLAGRVNDMLAQDELRGRNAADAEADAGALFTRWMFEGAAKPDGPLPRVHTYELERYSWVKSHDPNEVPRG